MLREAYFLRVREQAGGKYLQATLWPRHAGLSRITTHAKTGEPELHTSWLVACSNAIALLHPCGLIRYGWQPASASQRVMHTCVVCPTCMHHIWCALHLRFAVYADVAYIHGTLTSAAYSWREQQYHL